MIKITDEQAAKLGISSFEDLEKALSRGNKAIDLAESFKGSIESMTNAVKDLRAELDGSKIDVDAIVSQAVAKANAEAETIAAKAVSSAIARAGQSGLAPNKPQSEGNETKTQDDNDPESQWSKNANLRAEFNDSKSTFLAYHRAQTLGRISSVTKTVKN